MIGNERWRTPTVDAQHLPNVFTPEGETDYGVALYRCRVCHWAYSAEADGSVGPHDCFDLAEFKRLLEVQP